MKIIIIIKLIIVFLIIPNTSYAYIDPVSISYLITIIMSGVITFILQLKRINIYIKQLLVRLHITKDPKKEADDEVEDDDIKDKSINNK